MYIQVFFSMGVNGNSILQIYTCELEKAEKYGEFADFCHSFNFSRGKDEDEEESNIVGELKVR